MSLYECLRSLSIDKRVLQFAFLPLASLKQEARRRERDVCEEEEKNHQRVEKNSHFKKKRKKRRGRSFSSCFLSLLPLSLSLLRA